MEYTSTSYDCPAYSACVVEAFTAYIKITGQCEEKLETTCSTLHTTPYDVCAKGFRLCDDLNKIRDDYCPRTKEPQDCEFRIPIGENGKLWTEQYQSFELLPPVATGTTADGLCNLRYTDYKYNLKSGMYIRGQRQERAL